MRLDPLVVVMPALSLHGHITTLQLLGKWAVYFCQSIGLVGTHRARVLVEAYMVREVLHAQIDGRSGQERSRQVKDECKWPLYFCKCAHWPVEQASLFRR